MNTFKDIYTNRILSIIHKISSYNENSIIVLRGQSNQLNIDGIEEYLLDVYTFCSEKDDSLFSKEWFASMFPLLLQQKSYHLLSYAQFSYLTSYIDPNFFFERVNIINDNLRQLFPIDKTDFLEITESESLEKRPDKLPIHHAEQFLINDNYYYSLKNLAISYKSFDIFTDAKSLTFTDNTNLTNIDVTSDIYALDVFLNECIANNNLSTSAAIRFYKKNPLGDNLKDLIEKANSFLSLFGGSLFTLPSITINNDYKIKSGTTSMLAKYWGPSASFRDITVYKNPDTINETINLSQAYIVETIINEYTISRNGDKCRDLFLTAPTGAGKSLLFQLPAFYVAEMGDVTIVVSPLIALMKDQVDAIINDRLFNKVAYVNSELSLIDRERIIENCKNGHIDILYMSPELLLSYDITHFIGSRKLGLLVIDEAHLITTWGRDFRVDYWFLGNHIRKIRKYHSINFPMVAVTATAIYGGSNDMVFDSIDSLSMSNPHIFIGQVKRDDIEFVINNYDSFQSNYESSKIRQTSDFIRSIASVGLKTLVYAPYVRHIKRLLEQVNNDGHSIAASYYGSMDATSKEHAYREFRNGDKMIMVSTKAFGMGIDIPDIQVVYHHAPSGLLPDYVQEIGRVARANHLKGFATLNYSSKDQRYTRALHGMSALRQYQIREVLKKIYKVYKKNNNSRNLLLSVDDFGHIFANSRDIDQKVLTALMMVEKDYLAKTRFNVLIARPKKLFVKVYARLSKRDFNILETNYPNISSIIIHNTNFDNVVIEIDLDKLWYNHFVDKSFPIIKRHFYNNKLFDHVGIQLVPQLKISYELSDRKIIVQDFLKKFLDSLSSALATLRGFFSQSDFQERIYNIIYDKSKAEKLSKFILSTYSGQLIKPGYVENNAFLQHRRNLDGVTYQVYSNQYLNNFSELNRKMNSLFTEDHHNYSERFVTKSEDNTVNYVRLGYFLEILELGTFEVKGGDNPMIFIRLNDPYRIQQDAYDNNYSNTLLNRTLDRHTISNHIFDHFFLRSFTNKERWDFIEDFFLGSDVDTLINKYQGGSINNVDIITELNNKASKPSIDSGQRISDRLSLDIFPPNNTITYKFENLLTIQCEDTKITKNVSDWLSSDPVLFDQTRRNTKLKLNSEVFKILMTRLRSDHKDYLKSVERLKYYIDFKGYDRPVMASVPYNSYPVQFYKWWCNNPDKVILNTIEKYELFNKVHQLKPSLLKKEHKKLIEK